jgi:hypothetical protein
MSAERNLFWFSFIDDYSSPVWAVCQSIHELFAVEMSKLSTPLKALIDAPFARAGTTPAPQAIKRLYEAVGESAQSKKVEQPLWVAMMVRIKFWDAKIGWMLIRKAAATMTMNSPDSLAALHSVASANKDLKTSIAAAERIREVGLKCIGFNGVGTFQTLAIFTNVNIDPSLDQLSGSLQDEPPRRSCQRPDYETNPWTFKQ